MVENKNIIYANFSTENVKKTHPPAHRAGIAVFFLVKFSAVTAKIVNSFENSKYKNVDIREYFYRKSNKEKWYPNSFFNYCHFQVQEIKYQQNSSDKIEDRCKAA